MEHHHIENDPQFKGLSVNKGVEAVQPVNAEAALRFLQKKRRELSVDEYVEGILAGNITILSLAVTLIESSLSHHQIIGQQIIEKCLPYSGNSIRIGITGVPGAGKSTFIEAFGLNLVAKGKKMAVLAIDPSSERSKGSILGDKTRMEQLSAHKNAYIRPSPSAGSLGGVARKTRETIILCEAAGYDTIIIETVGVGQSETAVHSMVDFFLLLMISGAGDELQGIKRGIMEMADGISITKADGENVIKANLAQAQYVGALHLFPLPPSKWSPEVLTCSSLNNVGIEEIYEMIQRFIAFTKESDFFVEKRQTQSRYWMYESINEQIKNNFYHHSLVNEQLAKFETQVLNNEKSSFVAAKELIDIYFGAQK